MKKRTMFLSMLLCLSVLLPGGVCWAQSEAGLQPAVTNVPGAQYPRIGADSRVEFRFKAPDAQKVQVQVGAVQTPFDMVKGADGVWSVTTPPIVPGIHTVLSSS